MRYAVFLPIFDALADPILLTQLAVEAEEAGWDGFFVWDHISYRPPVQVVADPWITLGAVAHATERIRIGPMITPLPRRRPAKVARETATLDRLSGGRLTFGVGIGGDGSGELTATGEELVDRVRAQMLDESLDVLQKAWSGEPISHRGEHYVLDGVRFLPTPVQQPGIPIWVAVRYGNTRPLRRAARYQGVFPIDLDRPDQLTELLGNLSTLQADGSAPETTYDVAITGDARTDPAPFAEAGATWWLVGFDWQALSVDEVRSVIKAGPPSSSGS
jgi:alkanesulfonate monooxygenase SsuD/methylene tetrahydromethanopterin reductase-like flavin-dependent oxidoreductase (luciferase family)